MLVLDCFIVAWLAVVSLFLLAELRIIGAFELRLQGSGSGLTSVPGLPPGSQMDSGLSVINVDTNREEPLWRRDSRAVTMLFLVKPNCPACHRVGAWMRSEYKQWADADIVICCRGAVQDAKALRRLFPADITFVVDPHGAVPAFLGCTLTPALFITDQNGVILAKGLPTDRESVVGMRDQALTATAIAEALKGVPPLFAPDSAS